MHASGRPRETGRKWSMPREKIALAWSPRPGQARAIRGRTVISTAPGNGQTEAALAIVAAALASDRRRHVVLVGTTQADANDALGRGVAAARRGAPHQGRPPAPSPLPHQPP